MFACVQFVVDGNWTVNSTAPSEPDPSNNVNNVLTPSDLIPSNAHTMSTVTPGSTTAALAGQVPKEQPAGSQAISSAGPDSTTAGLAGQVPKESNDSALPGAFPETPFETPATEPQSFSVNPIPATAGASNPIQLEPGEKVPDPSTLTKNTVQSTVRHDAYDNDKGGAPQLGPVVTPDKERDAKGGMFGLPPISGNLIPESSLPIGGSGSKEAEPGVTIQSAGPTSTTAALAGQVPKEPKVPGVVTDSQKEAKVDPEASASAEAVENKKEVEREILKEVPTEKPAAESGGLSTGGIAATAAAAGTAAAGAAYVAKDKIEGAIGTKEQPVPASTVPDPVTKSISEAQVPPEAASSAAAVSEKAAVEKELLKEVKPVTESGEPAPTATAATTETAPSAAGTDSKPAALDVPAANKQPADSRDVSPTSGAPPAAAPANIAAATSAPGEKKAPETPLKQQLKDRGEHLFDQAKGAAGGGAKNGSAGNGTTAAAASGSNGAASSSAAATPDSAASKKKNRVSGFFGKLKDKLKN